jgi:hypothetical protein
MSVYAGTIKGVKEMLQASIDGFNLKKKNLQELYRNDREHSPSYIQEQLQIKREALKTETAGNLVDIQLRLAAAVEGTRSKLGSIKFPSVTSSLEATKTVGEVQQNTAQLFLMREHSRESILSSIRNALTLGRVDYAFALIEGAREAVKPVNGMVSQEGKQFLQDLAQIEAAFDATGKLAALSTELEGVPEIAQTIQHFQRFIVNEHLTGSYIPLAVVKEMSEAEIQANLESVNFAVSLGN